MATSVTLPALGESVTEGTVTRWLKKPGDQVAVDEPLLEVSTDKVDTEIPSPVAGTLLEIKAQEDETVEVGAELCTVGDENESAGSDDGSDQATAEEPAEEPAEEAAEAEQPDEGADDRRTQTETDPPAATTEQTPAAQETAPSSADSKPEEEASRAGASGNGTGTPVTLPALGESVTEGTVTRWLKQIGDEVAVDEPLLEVSTDKVDTEIPSPVAGTLLEIKVQEDETVEVGAELALVGSGSAAAPATEDKTPSEPAVEPEAETKKQPEPEPAAEAEPEPQPEPAAPASTPAPEPA
ncbi:MAG: 2-oxoglutarate dehydrogenase, E2 component, dihydrolipoamide succinyltransferase, partial [Nocardioidaceae bacterium]|nr:2-oxoglutarate dehydrogenase, E2 component, dihydrolipoamide succinyltransferase [Nocardioidaceae bacterium]